VLSWHVCVYMFSHNTEKVVYFLLLDRKLRNPSKDDDEDIKAKSECGSYIYLQLLNYNYSYYYYLSHSYRI